MLLKKITVPVLAASLMLISACSPNAELDAAKKKIASLEAELSAEKAKNAPVAAAVSASVAVAASAPEIKEEEQSGAQWYYQADEDKMSGGNTYYATVSSSNTVNFSFPYSGEQNARLSLRTSPRHGKDLIFSIKKGQILCRSYEDCNVLVRFDEDKASNYAAVGAADNSSETIFIRNYDKFLARLQKAKRVRISTDIYQQGSPVFEFDVSGFDREKYLPKK
ncbi:hypothetical protein [Janthinobacterium sp. PSPC3-1]|uniref:hypothetical protein n=1 Tax=Janthinobacterium sp. PSPC3-1 TaxID=2804653 RepID=UPI003CEA71CD